MSYFCGICKTIVRDRHVHLGRQPHGYEFIRGGQHGKDPKESSKVERETAEGGDHETIDRRKD